MLIRHSVADERRIAVAPVKVLAPDAVHLDRRGMSAVGLHGSLTPRRLAQLDHCRHMVAIAGASPVGFAAFDFTNTDMLVHELAAQHGDPEIVCALVGALELACLAAGMSRLFISARTATPSAVLERCAYKPALGAGWFEKTVP